MENFDILNLETKFLFYYQNFNIIIEYFPSNKLFPLPNLNFFIQNFMSKNLIFLNKICPATKFKKKF